MAKRFLAPRRLLVSRYLTAIGFAAAIAAVPVHVFAQGQLHQPKTLPPQAPAKLPNASKIPADRAKRLDFLFGALKAAPDEISAKHVEAGIWAIWLQTPSDTAALLMARAKAATDAQQPQVAIKLLDAIIKLRPDYVEAWNRRATLHYLQNDYADAMADIEQVLIREPRHFGALAGLGMIMEDLGDDKRALDAFRKALAINPHLDKVPELVKQLSEKVEGRDI